MEEGSDEKHDAEHPDTARVRKAQQLVGVFEQRRAIAEQCGGEKVEVHLSWVIRELRSALL